MNGINQIATQSPEPSENCLLVRPGEPAVADDIGNRIAAIFRVSLTARLAPSTLAQGGSRRLYPVAEMFVLAGASKRQSTRLRKSTLLLPAISYAYCGSHVLSTSFN